MRELVFKISMVVSVCMFLLTGCDPNRKCDKANCPPQTQCVQGQCLCPNGLEGEFCEILSYEKYLGTYQVSENCNPGQGRQYTTTIIKQTSDLQTITLTNMLGLGLSAEALVSGDFLTIPNQRLGATSIQGDGIFNGNTQRIELRYQHDFNNQLNECTALLLRF